MFRILTRPTGETCIYTYACPWARPCHALSGVNISLSDAAGLVELQAEVVNLKKLRLLQLKNQANALDKVPCGGGQNIDNMDTLPMDETFYDAPLSQHQAGKKHPALYLLKLQHI